MQDTPDIDLISRAKEGSEEAFAQLYHRYKERILNYLYGYIGDFASAQDLAQDAFLNAYKNINTFRFECKFSSWLYAIATNLAKNLIIKNKRTQHDSLDRPVSDAEEISLIDTIADTKPGPAEEMENDMLQEEIQRTLNALPEIYREVLMLCDVEGLSYEEAAEALGCKVGTIGSRLNEGRKIFARICKIKRK